jgi:hypothetical protein
MRERARERLAARRRRTLLDEKAQVAKTAARDEFEATITESGLSLVTHVATAACLSPKRVQEVAREGGIGDRMTDGWGGWARWVFGPGDVAAIVDGAWPDLSVRRRAWWAAARSLAGLDSIPATDAAEALGIDVASVHHWANKLGVAEWQQAAGRRLLFMPSSALDTIRDAIAASSGSAANKARMEDPLFKRDWYVARFNPPPTSPTLCQLNGKLGGSRGGRRNPLEAPGPEGDAMRQEVDVLLAAGAGGRTIADQLGVGHKSVRRYLARCAPN